MKEFIWASIVVIVFLVLTVLVYGTIGCASKMGGIRATEAIPLPAPLSIIRGAFGAASLIKLYPECADKESQGDCYACINEIIAKEGKPR